MTISTRQDMAEMTKLASALKTDTAALVERTVKHDSEAQEISRVRSDLSRRAEVFAKLAADSRAHVAKVLSQPAAKVANGEKPKPAVKAKRARKRNRKAKGTPKYRDPVTGQTWTGMGTEPNFIKQSGKGKDAFLIEESATA